MKRSYEYSVGKKRIKREYNYIPVRYILAILITVFEIAAIIGIVAVLCYYVPYFYFLAYATQIGCVIKIIASDDNPDYKVPWLLFVLILPIAGFMLYLMMYSRTLKRKYIKRLKDLDDRMYHKDSRELFEKLNEESPIAHAQAKMLCEISYSHLFNNVSQKYYSLGEEMYSDMLTDLKNARRFIFMEYFIIEEGKFWNSILEILKEKAAQGVEVRVVYDDIGCMSTLPGNYFKKLRKMGIDATPFSFLRGQADSEFNNRSHRKITVIDGYIGYTGGINIADEYINEKTRFGHWKDGGIRIQGEGVWELTRLFLMDYGINVKSLPKAKHDYFPQVKQGSVNGYVIPFGDGPRPLYKREVSKIAIQNMLNSATKYAYITTPYLIIDNELCQCIENTSLRGVDVKIILPHIPDKRLVFMMSRSFYPRLMDAGVEIYEYKEGFIHSKNYLTDDEYAIVGTANLDYRSLVHHFENGVWMYNTDVIADIKNDFDKTIEKSIKIEREMLKLGILKRFFRACVRVFAPLL